MTDEPYKPTDADDLTTALRSLVGDAMEIEGWAGGVTHWTPRKLLMRFGKDRYELTIVRKRG